MSTPYKQYTQDKKEDPSNGISFILLLSHPTFQKVSPKVKYGYILNWSSIFMAIPTLRQFKEINKVQFQEGSFIDTSYTIIEIFVPYRKEFWVQCTAKNVNSLVLFQQILKTRINLLIRTRKSSSMETKWKIASGKRGVRQHFWRRLGEVLTTSGVSLGLAQPLTYCKWQVASSV